MGAQAPNGFLPIEAGAKRVWTEPGQNFVFLEVAGCDEFGDGNAEAHGFESGCRDQHSHVARALAPPFARPVDVPAPMHPHVRPEDKAAREMHQDVLADRLDLGDRHRRQRVIVVHARQRRKHRLEADDGLTRERAVQGRRGAIDGVAFRHGIDSLRATSQAGVTDLEAHR